MKKLIHEWAPAVVVVCILEAVRLLIGPATAFILAVLALFTLVAFLIGVGAGLAGAEQNRRREP